VEIGGLVDLQEAVAVAILRGEHQDALSFQFVEVGPVAFDPRLGVQRRRGDQGLPGP